MPSGNIGHVINQFHQQPIGTIYNPPTNHIPSKPVFVMRFRSSMDDADYDIAKQHVWKSELSKEYHLILLRNDKDKDEFEMYNADKIERQDWNDIVNKIIK